MKNILDLQEWPSDTDECSYTHEDHTIKPLEKIAENLHNAINLANSVTKFFHLETLITGGEKNGYRLDIKITKGINEECKRKENTHKQETDI